MCYGHSISSPSLTLSTNTTPTYTSYVSTVADFALRSLYRQWKVCSDRFLCSVICLVTCRQVAEVDLRRYTEVAVRISPERHAGGIAVSCMLHLTDDCCRPHNHHHPTHRRTHRHVPGTNGVDVSSQSINHQSYFICQHEELHTIILLI